MANARLHIFKDVSAERLKQDEEWGEQNHEDDFWLAILTEELGEVAKAILNVHTSPVHGESDWTYKEILAIRKARDLDLQEELVQVAAVAVAWLECKKRNG